MNFVLAPKSEIFLSSYMMLGLTLSSISLTAPCVYVIQVIVFEEQEADYKIQFEDSPDLGMATDIQWLSSSCWRRLGSDIDILLLLLLVYTQKV